MLHIRLIIKTGRILEGYWFLYYPKIVQVTPQPIPPKAERIKLSLWEIDLFLGITRSIGGLFSLQKNSWYLLYFSWDPDVKWILAYTKSSLSINTPSCQTEIYHLPPIKSSFILGTWLAPGRESTDNVNHMWKTTDNWSDRVKLVHTSKGYMWCYYQTTVKNSPECLLVASTMT